MIRAAYRYRSPHLVLAILTAVYDSPTPYPYLELVDDLRVEGTSYKTVDNTIAELVAFGALHKVGKPGDRNRPETRALQPTNLGKAWLERQLLPLPGAADTDDWAPPAGIPRPITDEDPDTAP